MLENYTLTFAIWIFRNSQPIVDDDHGICEAMTSTCCFNFYTNW